MDTFSFTSEDGTEIACFRWPATKPWAALQIAHGMGEHALRYARFAEACVANGIEVWANDHRGHGRSAKNKDQLGDFAPGGWDALVADMAALAQRIHGERKNIPLVLLGHSMGSFAAQQFVLDHSDPIAALALSGSAAADSLPVRLEGEVDLTAINAAFEPARTPFDWLSRDEAEVDKYIADPLCGFGAKKDSVLSMARSLARTIDGSALARIRKDLPVYIFAGDRDPVNNKLAGLKPVAERYRAAGLKDVRERYYKDGRHEMLNETNRDEVIADFLGWMKDAVRRN